jgi:tetratricopeptide (TPR) repeat protein
MTIGVNPARFEIERQLDHMLAHPLFEAREMQTNIFEYLVKSALEGNKVDELSLFLKFYSQEKYNAGGTEVRTNVTYIRKLLKKYYDEDGEDDSVIIELPTPERTPLPGGKYKIVKRPPGGAYTPLFRYNPRSPIAKAFAVANHLLRGSVTQIDRGLKQLSEIWDMEPNHPDAILGYAEAVGSQLMLGLFAQEAREPLIAGALGLIERLDTATADEWRIHNLRGLLFMANGELEKAQKEFDSALSLDRQATVSWGWYTLFLFHVGREEEAVALQGLVADEKADNAGFQAMHGIYLTKAKRYEEAEKAFTHALTLDRNSWPAHYGITQMYLATAKERKAEEHLKRLKALVEPFEYEDMKRRLGAASQRPKRGRGV